MSLKKSRVAVEVEEPEIVELADAEIMEIATPTTTSIPTGALPSGPQPVAPAFSHAVRSRQCCICGYRFKMVWNGVGWNFCPMSHRHRVFPVKWKCNGVFV